MCFGSDLRSLTGWETGMTFSGSTMVLQGGLGDLGSAGLGSCFFFVFEAGFVGFRVSWVGFEFDIFKGSWCSLFLWKKKNSFIEV